MEVLRIHDDIPLYYLAFSVIKWLPIFFSEEPCLIVTDSRNYCHREKGLRTSIFCVMPTRIHLIATDADFATPRLRQTVMDMRKFTGRRLADYCERNIPTVFGRVLCSTRRTGRARQVWQQSRHAEAIYTQAFWQSKYVPGCPVANWATGTQSTSVSSARATWQHDEQAKVARVSQGRRP
jgi:hypothetical protein